MQQIPKTLKINFHEDMRRVPLIDTSYATLKKQASQLFSLSEGSFVIKYKDDEGDMVTIASEMEFKEALSFFNQNIIRLTVIETEKKENNNNKENGGFRRGRCGKKWGKWNKCENSEQKQDEHPHHHGRHHHGNHFHGNHFMNKIREMANHFIQGGQCDNLLENFLNSGFCKLEHNHICDGCDNRISGTRYHCKDCSDFDFCSECYEGKIKTHNLEHKFEKITALDALKEALKNGEKIDSFFMPGNSNDPVEKKKHHAFCDRCNSTIFGIRWKCLECPDFDFCNSCYVTANGIETINQHDKSHPFAKIEDPENTLNVFAQQKKEYLEKREKQEPKVEIKVEQPKEEPKIEIKVEQPKEEPKVEIKVEQPKEEQPKESYPFSKKLDDLSIMGFSDRKRNIQLLIKNKGDIQLTIQDLLQL